MSDSIRISVKAPTKAKADEVLEESFYKDLTRQAERLDKFTLELIKLQLAIPALYAGIPKLLEVREIAAVAVKTISVEPEMIILLVIFTPWLLALGVSFLAVFPVQHYDVKINPIMEPLPDKPTGQSQLMPIFIFPRNVNFAY